MTPEVHTIFIEVGKKDIAIEIVAKLLEIGNIFWTVKSCCEKRRKRKSFAFAGSFDETLHQCTNFFFGWRWNWTAEIYLKKKIKSLRTGIKYICITRQRSSNTMHTYENSITFARSLGIPNFFKKEY